MNRLQTLDFQGRSAVTHQILGELLAILILNMYRQGPSQRKATFTALEFCSLS